MGRLDQYREAVQEEQAFYRAQTRLHEKHEEIDPDAVIIEKTNTIKFLLGFSRGIARTAFGVLLILLAAVGVLALIYPEPRQEVFGILQMIMAEIWDMKA